MSCIKGDTYGSLEGKTSRNSFNTSLIFSGGSSEIFFYNLIDY
jgi:hypothetical protein